MLPTVAEVVEIDEFLRADVLEDIAEPRLARVEEVVGPIRIWIGRAPTNIAGAEFVEMAVGPTHRGLNGQVEPVEPDAERHLDAAQDPRLDVVEGES